MSLDLIFEAISSGRCLAFLGSGASTTFKDPSGKEVPGLPTGGELAEALATRCGYTNGRAYDLAKVAEYFLYRKSGDRTELERVVRENVPVACPPRPIHTVLAQLSQLRVVITTNYDKLLEHEIDRYGRLLTRHVHDQRDSKTGHFQGTVFFGENSKEIILHKMHGTIEDPGTMIITESDYIRYLAQLTNADQGMPEYFRKTIIPQFTLLFLGYSLSDWNFRVIWEGVLSSYPVTSSAKWSYALVKDAQPFTTTYWSAKRIQVIGHDLTDFAVALARQFNLEIPQLGMTKP